MASSNMSDQQSFDLTFGVELEFLLMCLEPFDYPAGTDLDGAQASAEADNFLKRLHRTSIIEKLRSFGLLINDYRAPENFAKWTVDFDAVTPTDDELENKNPIWANGSTWHLTTEEMSRLRYIGVEVSSRVLPFNPDSLIEVEKVIQIIVENFPVYVNKTCGLHVHVGNKSRGFNLQTLKNLATITTCFEEQLNSIHPCHRIGNDYCLQERLAFMESERKTELMAQVINDFKSLNDLLSRFGVNRCNPDECVCQWVVNYFNLEYCFARKPTIEFRQHAGSLDIETVLRWIKFTCRLVERCNEISSKDVRAIVYSHLQKPGGFDILDLLRCLELEDSLKDFLIHLYYHERDMPIHDHFLEELDET